MTFILDYPTTENDTGQIDTRALRLEPGEMLFVVGANGVGKSSLMHRFASQNSAVIRKISAHRQTWMSTDSLDMTPANKVQTEQNIKGEDGQQQSRYRDRYAAQRTSMTIFDLIDAENIRARTMAAAYDAGNLQGVETAAKQDAPITVINELLQQSNIPVVISIEANEKLVASKGGGAPYSAAQLSDGERNALLISGNVLTAPPGTLIIVDEPERHLHRSIISPLLRLLFERRPDCGFVISTHDHDLPIGARGARTLLLRSCEFGEGGVVSNWNADELSNDTMIDDELKRDLLGARRKILFVEGTESSLDKPLYSLLFPEVSVIPKGSCKDVERSVVGVRAGEKYHWLNAFGIADGDGLSTDEITRLNEASVYALPYYSVEAIYYHPYVIEMIAARQANVLGEDPNEMIKNAFAAGIAGVAGQTDRLSEKVAKKAIRKLILSQIPNDNELLNGQDLTLVNNAQQILQERIDRLNSAVASGNWEAVLVNCPVRESNALDNICAALRFKSMPDYEKSVRQLISTDVNALTFIRGLFGDLFLSLTGD